MTGGGIGVFFGKFVHGERSGGKQKENVVEFCVVDKFFRRRVHCGFENVV